MSLTRRRMLTAVTLALGIAPMVPAQAPQVRRGALRIAKIHSGDDKDITPQAMPNLTTSLRDKFKFDVAINHKELTLRSPHLVHYPLVYFHGQASVEFSDEDKVNLRRHLNPGGATLFVDASCGNPAFDAAFRKFVADLMPDNPLVAIPEDDAFFTTKAQDKDLSLAEARRTAAAGGKADYPDLEGVKVDGRWAIIYSKLDIGSALHKKADIECKGYTHESALRIATNVVIYATLP